MHSLVGSDYIANHNVCECSRLKSAILRYDRMRNTKSSR
jgi:hypothetical protein